MGSSASKAARKLPKRAEPPLSVGSKAPPPHRPRASEHKTEDIERDAQDPHFLANLNRLGPVRVDHHMQTIRLEATQSEHEASSTQPTKNRLTAFSLTELLDARKAARGQADIEQLAEKFGLDLQQMQNVTRFVSSPSVDSSKKIGQ
ncbi:hypothetical protein BDQ17DRAFT_1390969 [Cyathus striatus]|nr:hypothetical protein BDQ17DRAFT_1390969 [Cyathus striatus]